MASGVDRRLGRKRLRGAEIAKVTWRKRTMSDSATKENVSKAQTEWWPDAVRRLDCAQCKGERSMEPTKIPRFNFVLRLIGFILLVPSFLGFALAALIIVAMGTGSASSSSDIGSGGAALGLMFGFGFAVFVCVISLVMGLLGWILVWNRKVWKCFRCGYYVNRD